MLTVLSTVCGYSSGASFRHHNDTIVRAVGKWNMRVVVMGHVSGRMCLITGSEREAQPRANTSSSQTVQNRKKQKKGIRKSREKEQGYKKRTECGHTLD